MSNKKNAEAKACAWFFDGPTTALLVSYAESRIRIEARIVPVSPVAMAKQWRATRGVILMAPGAYSFGVQPAPEATNLDSEQLKAALRWAHAKDADISMADADMEVLAVPGVDHGGSLLKDSYWIFAVPRAKLELALGPFRNGRLKVEAVDVVATAQRNLCWAELSQDDDRAGAYASFVVGKSYSSLGIVSLNGDLLFHKQMEWTSEGLTFPESMDRVVVDLQRNLGYFERRVSAVGVVRGYVFGDGSARVAESLTQNMGSFAWHAGQYPSVDWGGGVTAENIDGDCALLLGSLGRWG